VNNLTVFKQLNIHTNHITEAQLAQRLGLGPTWIFRLE